MATPDIAPGELIYAMLFDPEVEDTTANRLLEASWLLPCGFLTTSYEQGLDLREDQTFDCDPTTGTGANTVSTVTRKKPMTISLSGQMAKKPRAKWQAVIDGKKPWPVRLMHDWAKADEGGYFEGLFIVTAMSGGGERQGGPATINISLTAANAEGVVWVDAS